MKQTRRNKHYTDACSTTTYEKPCGSEVESPPSVQKVTRSYLGRGDKSRCLRCFLPYQLQYWLDIAGTMNIFSLREQENEKQRAFFPTKFILLRTDTDSSLKKKEVRKEGRNLLLRTQRKKETLCTIYIQ